MAIYDVNAAIQKPNFANSLQQGIAFGQQQRAIAEQRADQNQLRTLAPQIIAGDPNAYREAAAIDPQAANQYQGAGDAQLKRLGGFVNFVEKARSTGNMDAVNAALRQGAPYIAQVLGKPGPTEWSDDMSPGWEALKAQIAMAEQSGTGAGVQSTYIDANGNRVAILRDGTTQILGQNAPNNQIIDTGNGFVGVNKTNLQAAPVMVGGQAPQAAQQAPAGQPGSSAAPLPPGGAQPLIEQVMATANQRIAAGEPEAQVDAWVQSQLQPAGNQFQNTSPVVDGPQQLRSAPKAPSVSETIAMENFNRQQSRTMSPEEVAAAGYRPGTIVQVDGYGNQKVMQAPQNESSAADRKDALARKAKLPQLQNAVRGLSRIESALSQLEGGLVNTGPIDAQIQRYTPAGQELEAAVGGIQNSFLALTRVPGIGSQSDLEARIANLQYPSLDKPPEVNRRTMENLRAFARDLQDAYQVATATDSEVTAPAPSGGPVQRARNPQTGQVLVLRDGQWVPE